MRLISLFTRPARALAAHPHRLAGFGVGVVLPIAAAAVLLAPLAGGLSDDRNASAPHVYPAPGD